MSAGGRTTKNMYYKVLQNYFHIFKVERAKIPSASGELLGRLQDFF